MFKGKLIPFGALVDFVPQKDVRDKQPKFDPDTVPGVFLGYILRPGGAWKGDFRVADLEVQVAVVVRRLPVHGVLVQDLLEDGAVVADLRREMRRIK